MSSRYLCSMVVERTTIEDGVITDISLERSSLTLLLKILVGTALVEV